MTENNHTWTQQDAAAASQEGWELWASQGEGPRTLTVCPLADSNRFKDDRSAVMHVYESALKGSLLHQKAMQLSLQSSPAFIPPRIGMEVTGGVIQCAWADYPAQVVAIDCDTDDVDDEHLVEVTYPDGDTVVGQVLTFEAQVLPGHVDAMVDAPSLEEDDEEELEDETAPRP